MRKIFDINSPLVRGLSTLADLLILNVLALLFCLPVLSVGASLTALYAALNRMQNEDGSPVKAFLAAFIVNFKQSSALWLIFLVIGAVICGSLYFSLQIATFTALVVRTVLFLMLVWYVMALSWVFPLQARFCNTVGNTLKNAFICAMSIRIPSLLIATMNILPMIVFLFSTRTFLRLCVLWLFFWTAFAAYCNLKILGRAFGGLIEQSKLEQGEASVISIGE